MCTSSLVPTEKWQSQPPSRVLKAFIKALWDKIQVGGSPDGTIKKVKILIVIMLFTEQLLSNCQLNQNVQLGFSGKWAVAN